MLEHFQASNPLGLSVNCQHVELRRLKKGKHVVIIVAIRHVVMADDFIVCRQRHGYLWLGKLATTCNRPEYAFAPAIAVVVEPKAILGQKDRIIALPSWYGRTSRRTAEDFFEQIIAFFELMVDVIVVHVIDAGLPGMVVIGVQTYLMAGIKHRAYYRAQLFSDDGSRPEGAPQKYIPSIQTCRPRP